MAMVFTLASQLREDLTQHLANQESEKERQTQEARNKEHEAEERRFKGTKVTAETFMAWKIQFDVEMAANKEAEQASSGSGKLVKKDDKKKQTGESCSDCNRAAYLFRPRAIRNRQNTCKIRRQDARRG